MTKAHLKRRRRALGRERGPRRARRRRMLLWVGAGAAALALVGGALFASGSGSNGPDAASEAAPIEFSHLSGERGSLADFEGEPVVMNFFASWCGPCWQEMPGFERVYQRTEGEVVFLGMALQDTPDATRRIVEQTEVNYPIGTDHRGEDLPAPRRAWHADDGLLRRGARGAPSPHRGAHGRRALEHGRGGVRLMDEVSWSWGT